MARIVILFFAFVWNGTPKLQAAKRKKKEVRDHFFSLPLGRKARARTVSAIPTTAPGVQLLYGVVRVGERREAAHGEERSPPRGLGRRGVGGQPAIPPGRYRRVGTAPDAGMYSSPHPPLRMLVHGRGSISRGCIIEGIYDVCR